MCNYLGKNRFRIDDIIPGSMDIVPRSFGIYASSQDNRHDNRRVGVERNKLPVMGTWSIDPIGRAGSHVLSGGFRVPAVGRHPDPVM